MRLGALTIDTTSIREVAAIIIDALRGSRCGTCGERWRDLASHLTWDHGDE